MARTSTGVANKFAEFFSPSLGKAISPSLIFGPFSGRPSRRRGD